MRITVGSDTRAPVTDAVIAWLGQHGHDVALVGPLVDGDDREWAEVGAVTARDVVEGRSDLGVLFCWTGTGVSIAANKVPGARAGLCGDAETARLARKYNHANVLAMSVRSTSPVVAVEIIEAFLGEPWGEDDFDLRNARAVDALDGS